MDREQIRLKDINRKRTVLFWVFLLVFLGSAVVALAGFLKQSGLIGEAPSQEIPLLKYLLASVVIEASLAIFGFWKDLSKLIAHQDLNETIGSESISDLLIDMVQKLLQEGDVDAVLRWLARIRDEFLPIMSSNLLFLEGSIRAMLGHGHFIRDICNNFESDSIPAITLTYEWFYLGYAQKYSNLNPKFNIENLPLDTKRLWLSLLTINNTANGKINDARRYFEMIDHNVSVDGMPLLTETDNHIAYSALAIALTACALDEPRIAEGYFNIVKHIPSNIKRNNFHKNRYPYISLVGRLHHSFLMALLGFKDGLDDNCIKCFPGHARIIARHCQVVLRNDTIINTIVGMSQQWSKERRLSKEKLIDSLRRFEKKLIANASTIYSGMSAK